MRDPSLAALPVNLVTADSAEQALDRALKGSGARARRIAPNTWLIERDRTPKPAKPKPAPKPPRVPLAAREPGTEIVVTATKQATPLQNYAGNATILAGASISLAQATRGTDAIVEHVPSLVTTHLGPGRNKIFIRGIADSSFIGPTQGTVGQYWGDTRMAYSAPDPDLRLYDIRSIEVLEGPQGTLYGAGALGGIVKITPNPPELTDVSGSGWAGVQATTKGRVGGDVGAQLNLPLVTNTLGFRALAYSAVDGGYIDDSRRLIDDVNRVRTTGGRAMLRWQPPGDWTFDLNGTYQRIKGSDAQYADASGDRLTRASAVAQPFSDRFALGEVVARGKVAGMDLSSSIGLVDQHISEAYDATVGINPTAYDQTFRTRLLTSETRLSQHTASGTSWVMGVSLLGNVGHLARVLGGQGGPVPPRVGVRSRVEEATLFGEITVPILSWLRATAGGRLTQSWLSGNPENLSSNPSPITFDAAAKRTEFRALPSGAIVIEPFRYVTAFVRHQQSYRPGGLVLRGTSVQRFRSDTVQTTEVGARYTDPADRLNVALTLAATDWSDIQADVIDPFGFPVTSNIGDGVIHSLALSVRVRPTTSLAFDTALYLNDSKVTRVDPNSGAVQVRGTLPNVADVTARIGVDWRHRLSETWQLDLGAAARYVGKSRLGVGERLGKQQGDYFDTSFEARATTGPFGISLDLTNVFDSRGSRFALGSPFLVREDQIVPMRPRTLRLGIDAAF